MTKTQTLEFYKHSFQSLLTTHNMTSSTVRHVSLNTPPKVDSQTLDEHSKIIKDMDDVLLKKKLLRGLHFDLQNRPICYHH